MEWYKNVPIAIFVVLSYRKCKTSRNESRLDKYVYNMESDPYARFHVIYDTQ